MDNTNSMDNSNKINISLEYNPTRDDVSPQVPKGQGRLPQTPFLTILKYAGKTTGYTVHGNSRIKVYEDGREVSRSYDTWRRWRIWHLSWDSLNPDGPPQQDWLDDNMTNIPNWIDIPGYNFAVSPDQWKSNRYMLEFVVSVKPYVTAIDALYFYVIVSVKPGEYRVQMSSAKSIPFKGWDTVLKPSSKPWAQDSGCDMPVVDSEWLKFLLPHRRK
jgi:hypothetical protein